ncbi:hypothetical protein [Aporhodopirellula aestuarii]|uniref:Secreted protein n=1 Tax=Aporhodopirellula aestuarii TaxID=2950107 RepID=A0ABT0TYT0_9BACT|nr:hypothetical protein [Aporhodopirellula aestuarii]MCM2369735.1 hypothetical protein [Aporhodopirellula aestuarii]
MMRFIMFSAVLCVASLAVSGCGGSGASAPSGDEISNFVADNPEMMEETKRYQADPMDDSFEE